MLGESLVAEESFAEGLADGGRRIADFEFFVDVADVGIDGAVADVELVGDFLLHQSLGEEFENFVFAFCEVGIVLFFGEAVLELVEDEAGDVGIEGGPTGHDISNRAGNGAEVGGF